jgi:hypothetical protein
MVVISRIGEKWQGRRSFLSSITPLEKGRAAWTWRSIVRFHPSAFSSPLPAGFENPV